MKYHSILLISSLVSSTLFAASFNKRDAVQELVQKLEAIDPNIKSHQDDWLKVRNHLEQASQQSETAAGLRLSVQHILDQWGGLHFKVLDPSDAQYWALNGEQLALPSAWFSQRGAKWVVQYSATKKLSRGDSFPVKAFAPFSKESQALTTWSLPLQTKAMGTEASVSVPVNKQSLDQWALELTQSSSTAAIVDGKRVCVEKVWFWLNKTVATNIASKLDSSKSSCQALLIDLRDVFGEGLDQWPKLSGKMPVAVLTNQGTREAGVKLARHLKAEGKDKTKVFGETTNSGSVLQKKEALTKSAWTLIVVGDGEGLIPDTAIKDSYLNAEGVDDIREAGLSWVRGEIIR